MNTLTAINTTVIQASDFVTGVLSASFGKQWPLKAVKVAFIVIF